MFKERIRSARVAAGLTLEEMGAALGLSHAAVQRFEKGTLVPSSAHLLGIARACNVRTEYFFRAESVQLRNIEFRKHAGFSKTLQDAAVMRVRDQVEKHMELISAFPTPPLPAFKRPSGPIQPITHYDETEALALTLRKKWNLGTAPIRDLTDTLESRGLIVVRVNIDHAGFSGLSALAVRDGSHPYPILAVSSRWPGDRQRSTLAHELGHLILEGKLATAIDHEKSCDRFAAAFLVPKPVVFQMLGRTRHALEWRELYCLKHEFGLSMLGWLMRARHCEIITEATYVRMIKEYKARGWKEAEPGKAVQTEVPQLFEQLVYRALAEQLISDAKAAELLGVPLLKFHKQRLMEWADDPAHQ